MILAHEAAGDGDGDSDRLTSGGGSCHQVGAMWVHVSRLSLDGSHTPSLPLSAD